MALLWVTNEKKINIGREPSNDHFSAFIPSTYDGAGNEIVTLPLDINRCFRFTKIPNICNFIFVFFYKKDSKTFDPNHFLFCLIDASVNYWVKYNRIKQNWHIGNILKKLESSRNKWIFCLKFLKVWIKLQIILLKQ